LSHRVPQKVPLVVRAERRFRSVVFPEPDGPMIAVTRPL